MGHTERHKIVRFADFVLDLRAGELRKAGSSRPISLSDQLLQVLRELQKQPGQMVSREELIQRLWPGGGFGDFDHGLNKAVNKLREALGDSAEKPKFIETVARRGYRFLAPVENEDAAGASIEASIAVLPFTNLSGDPGQDYFADGMTEALITELGKISALRVISRQSMMQYKGTKKSAEQIAQELNVEGIVEGSVLRVGDRVRTTAQLIAVRPERHLWANSYDRELRDVLELENEMARAVAKEIKVTLTPEDEARLRGTRTVNPPAYEAYLQGRYFLDRRTKAGVDKALAISAGH